MKFGTGVANDRKKNTAYRAADIAIIDARFALLGFCIFEFNPFCR